MKKIVKTLLTISGIGVALSGCALDSASNLPLVTLGISTVVLMGSVGLAYATGLFKEV